LDVNKIKSTYSLKKGVNAMKVITSNDDVIRLNDEIVAHCESVMSAQINRYGSVGMLLSDFVMIPSHDITDIDMEDIYEAKEKIEDELNTDEYVSQLIHVSQSQTGELDYILNIEVYSEKHKKYICSCCVEKLEGVVTAEVDVYEL
jgi:hypothetical protein